MKLKKLMASIAVVCLIVLVACKKDTFEHTDGLCPQVLYTDPSNGATMVPLSQVITVTFNEEMNPATINSSSFIVTGSVVPGTVTYSGKTASFTPTSPLIPNHTYTGRVTTAVKDLMGNALQTDYIWTFSTGAIIVPMVVSTDPADNDTGVVLNKVISATFNMEMDPATFNNANFTVKQGSTPIAGAVSYFGTTTAYFTPTLPLDPNKIYTATITTGTKNTAGTSISNDYVWSFKTGTITAPIIVSTDPVHNSVGVALNKIVTATFSEPMDPLTINNVTFTLRLGSDPVLGTVTYSGNMASFTPAANLLPGVLYTATITTGAKNPAGTSLANSYKWTFMTLSMPPVVVSTDPANNATGVILNKTISATFNVPMDPLTINAATFTLKQGTAQITGNVTYSGNTASFKPSVALLPNTVYTATITTGAKNSAGTPMSANYTWTFTTGTTLAPFVTSTDPANNANGVNLNKIVSANFNMAMDPLTINSTTFTLKQGINTVAGIVSYSGTMASFKPSVNLLPGTNYTATITKGAKNLTGTPIVNDYVWTFTTAFPVGPTVISTNPANNAIDVALDKTVTATFSTQMDPLTISSATFTLKQGTNSVSGVVSYSGSTASFNPSVDLLSGSTYTATITTGAKNTAGTPLANNYVWTFKTKAPAGPNAPDLKSAGNYGILAYSAVNNNAGPSVINNMNVGIYPGTSITGFPPGKVVNGVIQKADDASPVPSILIQAKNDLTAAYLYAEGATSPAPATVSGNQGGKTLAPGIYKSTSVLSVEGSDLTLDAKGDANAVWIFQIASTLITTTGGNIVLSGGAQAKNVYWQVGSSATIGDYTSFKGNILALVSITMNGYATVTGRMLTQNAAVTLTSTNTINKP